MFEPILEQFGLAKNEATIYEVILREGEASVATISRKSEIHRRNVYDSLQRLMEKGFVFEAISRTENLYRAVSPRKLEDLWEEKKRVLDRSMPHMLSMFEEKPQETELFIYRGDEGWKHYMRDIISVGEDFYCIAGKGAWLEARTSDYFSAFLNGLEENSITMHHLFDAEVQKKSPKILELVGSQYKFIPEKYSAASSVDIFGDRVCIASHLNAGGIAENDFTISVIINRSVADSFRTWFKFMWDAIKE